MTLSRLALLNDILNQLTSFTSLKLVRDWRHCSKYTVILPWKIFWCSDSKVKWQNLKKDEVESLSKEEMLCVWFIQQTSESMYSSFQSLYRVSWTTCLSRIVLSVICKLWWKSSITHWSLQHETVPFNEYFVKKTPPHNEDKI